MMKKYILLLFIITLSIPLSAQLEVKENSFKKSEGFVNINPRIQSDDNDVLYAVIKVKTENINDEQRQELLFGGNAATFIELEYKVGEVWVYISSKPATYLKVSHPDLSSTEFWFPFDLEPKQGYELTLVNNTKTTNGHGTLEITTNEVDGAAICINGEVMSYKTPHIFDFFPAGTYDIMVSKEKYKTTRTTITVRSGEKRKIDIQMPVAFGVLSINTKPTDADIYLDGKLCGQTPLSTNITAEKHKIKLLKDGYKPLIFDDVIIKEDESFIIDTALIETFDIKINTNGRFDKLYVDGQYEGYSPVTRQLSPGKHIIKIERGYENIEVFEEEIVIEPNGQKVFNLILDSKLNINTDRESIIYIDDKRMGEAPLSLELPKGQHHIKAIHNEKQVDTIIDLVQGEEYDLFLDIPKSRDERLIRFDYGLFAGLGGSIISSISKPVLDTDAMSFPIGLYITAKIHRLGIKFGVTYRMFEFKFNMFEFENLFTSESWDFHFSTTNIPIMFGYETDETNWITFGAYIGPQINICNSATYDVSESSISKNLIVPNYEKKSVNMCGEINIGSGSCFEKYTITYSLKFDLTREILLRDGATSLIGADIGCLSLVIGMQLDYNF